MFVVWILYLNQFLEGIIPKIWFMLFKIFWWFNPFCLLYWIVGISTLCSSLCVNSKYTSTQVQLGGGRAFKNRYQRVNWVSNWTYMSFWPTNSNYPFLYANPWIPVHPGSRRRLIKLQEVWYHLFIFVRLSNNILINNFLSM